MREFKRKSLDGKGNDLAGMDGKLNDYEYPVKPVPANYDKTSRYDRPESIFASEKSESSKLSKSQSDWLNRHPGTDESEPSEFTWKFSDREFKFHRTGDPVELKRGEWPTRTPSPEKRQRTKWPAKK